MGSWGAAPKENLLMLSLCWHKLGFRRLPGANPQWYLAPCMGSRWALIGQDGAKMGYQKGHFEARKCRN